MIENIHQKSNQILGANSSANLHAQKIRKEESGGQQSVAPFEVVSHTNLEKQASYPDKIQNGK